VRFEMKVESLAYVVDGNTRWGSPERCARVAETVRAAFGERGHALDADRIAHLGDDELFTSLFFDARASRHGGSPPVQSAWSDAVVAELRHRLGDERLEALARGPEGTHHRLSARAVDAALGAMLGAACGDAAGAVLEFLGRAPTAAEVERALSMPGGGVWRVAPGQITDDSELMLALADAMFEAGTYDEDRVAQRYVDWLSSQPFDIGTTTATAFLGAREAPRGFIASSMRAAARSGSAGSKANGSLMRASPLGVYGHRLGDEALARIARADSGLSHPNPACTDAVAAYALAQAHLIRHPGDRSGAFERAEHWCDTEGDQEVRGWIRDARAGTLHPFHPQAGFVRIAFTAAFAQLRAGRSYLDGVRATLAGGGDTDTNACIVGGLLGAADGAEGIPAAMRTAVLEGDTTRGRARPDWLHPRRIPELVEALGWCGARDAASGLRTR
jgi:ADP-ribosylglycohydrolase